jgi:hypothetical protein
VHIKYALYRIGCPLGTEHGRNLACIFAADFYSDRVNWMGKGCAHVLLFTIIVAYIKRKLDRQNWTRYILYLSIYQLYILSISWCGNSKVKRAHHKRWTGPVRPDTVISSVIICWLIFLLLLLYLIEWKVSRFWDDVAVLLEGRLKCLGCCWCII